MDQPHQAQKQKSWFRRFIPTGNVALSGLPFVSDSQFKSQRVKVSQTTKDPEADPFITRAIEGDRGTNMLDGFIWIQWVCCLGWSLEVITPSDLFDFLVAVHLQRSGNLSRKTYTDLHFNESVLSGPRKSRAKVGKERLSVKGRDMELEQISLFFPKKHGVRPSGCPASPASGCRRGRSFGFCHENWLIAEVALVLERNKEGLGPSVSLNS